MANKVTWAPSPENDIASYDLFHAGTLAGPFTFLVNITHDLAGPNYDSVNHVFFYNDSSGVSSDYYELTAIDTAGNHSLPSNPFKPVAPAPAIPATVTVNHNYPTPGALRYQNLSSVPIEGAVVRIFLKADYDVGDFSAPQAVTITDSLGNWVDPVFLPTGYTYAVQFFLDGLYGPDRVDITL